MVKFYARHYYFWSNVAIYAHCVAFQLNFMVKFYAILAIYAILAEFYGFSGLRKALFWKTALATSLRLDLVLCKKGR